VTLTGPGGSGKTRLAQRIAAEVLDDFEDGVWLVELADLTEPGLVAPTVCQTIGVRDAPGRTPLGALADAFGSGSTLLVLDNCEHLVDACATLVEGVLRACPRTCVLATSREPLGVVGELTWMVPPLAMPSGPLPLAEMLGYDAVQLFVQRARAARPGFSLDDANASAVAQLCRRLDGLPLAIELAAARVRSLTPSEIALRLDDRFALLTSGPRTSTPRQQTLLGALDWSYELLSPAERELFAALSVFSGGFDVDAVRSVRTGGDEEVLARLVDRSLVVAESDHGMGSTRYRLLESVRAYADRRLVEAGAAPQVRQQHAAWIVGYAKLAAAAFHGPEQGRWLRWSEREHDNVRAALGWLFDSHDPQGALEVVARLWWSWTVHMRWDEARSFFGRVLTMPGAEQRTAARGEVLLGASTVAAMLGDLTACQGYLDEASAIGVALGDRSMQMMAQGIGQIGRQYRGDQGATIDAAQDLLDAALNLGNTWAAIRGLETMGASAASQGDYSQAAAYLEEGVRLARREGDDWSLSRCLVTLGDVERSRGDYARAARLYVESQVLFAGIGLGTDPSVLHNLGYVALAEGDRRRGATSFLSALALFRRIGDRRGAAECIIGIGGVLAAGGEASAAVQLFAAGEAALASMHSQLWPANRRDYDRWLGHARARLSEESFADAWSRGSSLSLEEAIASASKTAVPTERGASELTSREREVAALLARGLSNREIGHALVVTEKTAANHVQRVLDKLGVHSRTQLAARAAEFGLS
jgi:non-specific serine/threonine protein kinase